MKHLFLFLLSVLVLKTSVLAQETKAKLINTDSVTANAFQSFFIFFETAGTVIDEGYHDDLANIAAQLVAKPEAVVLQGFTDDVGNTDFNKILSQKRAQAVKQVLTAAGVEEALIELVYFGEDQPMADNSTPEGRSQNRRVEIILKTATPQAAGNTVIYSEEKADDLLAIIKVPEKAKPVARDIPVISKPMGLVFEAKEHQIISSNGGTVLLNYRYNSGSTNPKSILFKVSSASSFYDYPVTNTTTRGELSLPMSFPPELGEGEIAVVACLMNMSGQLSATDTTIVKMSRLGTGILQISLSWDNKTDQDIYVVTPDGEKIYYENKESWSGGELDRDDEDGFGPENIFWEEKAPDGVYSILVNDYKTTSYPTSFVITFNGLGEYRQFYGTTQNGSTAKVGVFVKEGDTIIWKEIAGEAVEE